MLLRTSPFAPNQPYYSNSALTVLSVPSNDSRELVRAAQHCLTQIWRPGYRYQKAGVMLTDFWPAGTYQPSMFDEVKTKPRSKQLMAVLDTINNSGKGRIFLAAEGINTDWQMKRAYLSPAYTTRISDLPKVT